MKPMMNEDTIIELAVKSLIHEASLYPKPGLVDPVDCGSHDDMDYYTFIDSSFALTPGFRKYYQAGQLHSGSPRELFNKIRTIGIANEKSMFQATGNINTHKGANFLYGLVISAIAYGENPTLKELRQLIQEMTKGLVEEELASLKTFYTHGEKVYQKYGFTGIRGEVEEGIPLVFEHALPIIDRYGRTEEGLKKALLELIHYNNDSNMLKRGGIEGLNYGKTLAGQSYEAIDQHLLFMNQSFVERNLNPGGSADLLALSIFLKSYEEKIKA